MMRKIASYGESNLTERGQGGSHEVFMANFQKSHTSATFTALQTAFMWGSFPTPSNFLQRQLIVLQVNSILTLSTQKEQHFLQIKRSVPQSTPRYTTSDTIKSPDFHLFFRTTRLVSSNNFLLGFDWFARVAHRTQRKLTEVFQFIKGYDKGYRWTTKWRAT